MSKVSMADYEALLNLIYEIDSEMHELLNLVTSTTEAEYISAKTIMAMLDEDVSKYLNSMSQIERVLITGIQGGCVNCANDLSDLSIEFEHAINAIIMKVLLLYPAKEEVQAPVMITHGMPEDEARVLAVLINKRRVPISELAVLVGSKERAEEIIKDLVDKGLAMKVYNIVTHTTEVMYREGSADRLILTAEKGKQ
jgi:hypothetical protein